MLWEGVYGSGACCGWGLKGKSVWGGGVWGQVLAWMGASHACPPTPHPTPHTLHMHMHTRTRVRTHNHKPACSHTHKQPVTLEQ